MTEYEMIPVEPPVKRRVMLLAERKGFGRRGQGAFVKLLVKVAWEQARAEGVLTDDDVKEDQAAQAARQWTPPSKLQS